MGTHADKTHESKSQTVANTESQEKSSHVAAFQFTDNRPEAVAQRKLQEMATTYSAPIQRMAATKEFIEKHTAVSESDAIEKSKNRSGKWKTNSIMDFGEERTPYNFAHDETLSGPFSVAADGWVITKTKGGADFKGTIEGRSGLFTGTASRKTDDKGKVVGEANHSDGFTGGITGPPKAI
jgi:hypothetical protein